jgi:hypothetical protein
MLTPVEKAFDKNGYEETEQLCNDDIQLGQVIY